MPTIEQRRLNGRLRCRRWRANLKAGGLREGYVTRRMLYVDLVRTLDAGLSLKIRAVCDKLAVMEHDLRRMAANAGTNQPHRFVLLLAADECAARRKELGG